MSHYGMLQAYRFSDDVDNIMARNLYGYTGKRLGKIDDVVFDHATGTIQYAVVDTADGNEGEKFLVPATSIRDCEKSTPVNSLSTRLEAHRSPATVRRRRDARRVRLAGLRRAISRGMGERPGTAHRGSTHAITPRGE